MSDRAQPTCEFIRHYNDRPAVFCDQPATHWLTDDFTQTGHVRTVPFCHEHAELLRSERADRLRIDDPYKELFENAPDCPPMRDPEPRDVPTDPRVAAFSEAFQDCWNDFCTDTGDHPDFVQHHGREILSLDTIIAPFDAFVLAALTAADAVDPLRTENAILRTIVNDPRTMAAEIIRLREQKTALHERMKRIVDTNVELRADNQAGSERETALRAALADLLQTCESHRFEAANRVRFGAAIVAARAVLGSEEQP